MASKPLFNRLVKRVRGTDGDGDQDFKRRKVLKSSAALATSAGLASAAGAASASSGDSFSVQATTAEAGKLSEITPLLEALEEDGLVADAAETFADIAEQPLGQNDSGSAVLDYGNRVVHTYVLRADGSKLTINLAEGDDPYAVYAPNGGGPGSRVRYDLAGGSVETVEMEYTSDVSLSADSGCGDNCGGSTCSPAGNCWWEKRECDESCRKDGGGYYCHDDCHCGC